MIQITPKKSCENGVRHVKILHAIALGMSVPYPTKLVLAFRSGNLCAFPGCSRRLTVDGGQKCAPAVIGEAAHIAGEKPGAARYDASMSEQQRNHSDNLIYLLL